MRSKTGEINNHTPSQVSEPTKSGSKVAADVDRDDSFEKEASDAAERVRNQKKKQE